MQDRVPLSSWLTSIDSLLKNEKDPLPSNFLNIAEYFINQINEILSTRRPKFTKYDNNLFEDLCYYLENKNDAIKKCVPVAVYQIVKFKNSPLIKKRIVLNKSSKLALKQLRRNLTRIKNIYNSSCFVSEITRSVVNEPMHKKYQQYLIRKLETNYDRKVIYRLIKENIAKNFYKIYKDKYYSTVTNDEYLKNNTARVYNDVRRKFNESLNNLKDKEKVEECLSVLFYNNTPWKYTQNALIEEFKPSLQIFNSYLLKNVGDLMTFSLPTKVLKKVKMQILIFIRKIISHFIFWSLTKPHENMYSSTVNLMVKDQYFTNLWNCITKSIDEENKQIKGTFEIGESVISQFVKYTSEIFCEAIDPKIIDKELVSFILRVTNIIQNNSLDEFSNDSNYTLQNLLNYKIGLFEYIDDLTKKIIDWMVQNKESLDLEINNKKNVILLKLADALFEKFSQGENINNNPSTIKNNIWRKLVNALIKQTKSPRKKPWRVVFLVGNLDCNGRVIKIGRTVFYDARKWDFGENHFMDSSKDFKISINEAFTSNFQSFSLNHRKDAIMRNSARAMITVDAIDESKALEISRNILIRSINLLVFKFSDEYYGFRPQLPLYYQLTDMESNRTPSAIERDQFYGIFKIDDENQHSLESSNNFLSTAVPKNEQIFLAMEWYRNGTWDYSRYGKFVSYWIALEKIVDDYSTLKTKSLEPKLLRYLPKLTTTWRNTSIWYNVHGHLTSIIVGINQNAALKKKLDKNPRMADWEKGYSILENLEYLAKITQDQVILKQIDMLKAYLTPELIRKVKKELKIKRKNEKFRIAYLYSVRNSIFHEGRTFSEERLTGCNVVLRNILNSLLLVLTLENFDTLSKVIKYANRPYCW